MDAGGAEEAFQDVVVVVVIVEANDSGDFTEARSEFGEIYLLVLEEIKFRIPVFLRKVKGDQKVVGEDFYVVNG